MSAPVDENREVVSHKKKKNPNTFTRRFCIVIRVRKLEI